MKKVTTKKKVSGSKKKAFAKRESSGAFGLVIGLLIFNFAYAYAIGIPLPRTIVASYVESVQELGDAQARAYEYMGEAIAETGLAVADTASETATAIAAFAVSPDTPRNIITAYVDGVYAIGDAQAAVYDFVGEALVETGTTVAETVMETATAVAAFSVSQSAASPEFAMVEDDKEPSPPEPLLRFAPNQISIAK